MPFSQLEAGPLDEINTCVMKAESKVFQWVLKTQGLGLYMVPHCITPETIGEKGQTVAMELAKNVNSI